MSCYVFAQITIHDPALYAKYLEGTDPVLARYNGTVVAVDDRPTLLEGEWRYRRAVMIRFASEADARAWYDSVEYQELAAIRKSASSADVILVHGRD